MKGSEKKEYVKKLVHENIEHYFKLLEDRFKPEFDHKYIKEILNFSKSFNIRLTKEQKLKFCKKCFSYLNSTSREIRLNSTTKTKDYICKNCGFVRRFPYK